jgi:hypothetical protein
MGRTYQSVQFSLRLGETLVVLCVDKEDYAGDLGEVLSILLSAIKLFLFLFLFLRYGLNAGVSAPASSESASRDVHLSTTV